MQLNTNQFKEMGGRFSSVPILNAKDPALVLNLII
ncbi:hypothetical protein AAAC51_43885 [Priestia megaterium]